MPQPRTSRSTLLSDRALERLAGAQSFERGKKYFADGRVSDGVASEDGLSFSADVSGSGEYGVLLRIERKTLTFECSCPVGEEGALCKHCVAAALAWRAESLSSTKAPPPTSAATSLDDVRVHLLTQPKRALVDMILGRRHGGVRRRSRPPFTELSRRGV